MSDWIDFTVYAAFLAVLFFVFPRAQQRLTIPMLAVRNPDWVAAHAEAVQRIGASRWRLWLCYCLGTISLAALAGAKFGLWHAPVTRSQSVPSWMTLWLVTMACMTSSLLISAGVALHGAIRLKRLVPVAPRRSATLQPRSLDDYIPRWAQRFTYALVAANLAAWLVVGLSGVHHAATFWPRTFTLFALSLIFFFAARAMVARRANVMDRVFGPGYRAWETRWVFATQLLVPPVGALRLYEEVTGSQLLDLSRALQLFLTLFIAWVMWRQSQVPAPEHTA